MNAEVYFYTLDGSIGETFSYKSIHLQEGKNSFGNETITLRKMQFCYAITSESNGQYQHKALEVRYIKLVLPNEARVFFMTLHVYFTTEEKSFAPEYGLHLSEGDAQELKLRMRKWDEELWGFVELKSKMTKFIQEKSGCRMESPWKLIEPAFATSVKEKCGTKACLPKGFPFENIDLKTCENFIEYGCSSKELKRLLKTDKEANTKPCTKVEYSGNAQIYPLLAFQQMDADLFFDNYFIGKGNYLIQYNFKQPETVTLNEEYYTVQTLDLIGVAGGTLGMFVEFTFYGLFSFLLNIIQHFTSRIKGNGRYQNCTITT